MNQPSVIDTQHHQFSTYWQRLSSMGQSPYKINAAFSELQCTLNFDQAPNRPSERDSKDHSFVVVKDDKPLIGCCLILQQQTRSKRTLDCTGLFVTSEFDAQSLNSLSHNVESEVFSCLNQHLDALLAKLQPDLLEFFDSMDFGIMSPVSHWLLKTGAMPVLCPTQLIDLRASKQKLEQDLSRLNVDAIAWGEKNLTFQVLDSPQDLDSSVCASSEFVYDKRLTSTPDSENPFQDQASNSYYRSLLEARKAFIIQAFADGNLIASSTFSLSKDKAHYIASIVGTNINAEPILQSLVWEGIKYSKSLGLSWAELTSFELDETDNPLRGFGGISQTRFKLRLTAKH
ncbi:MAG: hypothetical protein ACI95C_002564 [Pseudohongiellaceae bacterium]|jgi:hypothetical protein